MHAYVLTMFWFQITSVIINLFVLFAGPDTTAGFKAIGQIQISAALAVWAGIVLWT